MTDKITKEIKKYSPKEKKWVEFILRKVKKGDLHGLEIKKLKGRQDIFRVRKGGIRIIYKSCKGKVSLIAVERRSDNTYKFKNL